SIVARQVIHNNLGAARSQHARVGSTEAGSSARYDCHPVLEGQRFSSHGKCSRHFGNVVTTAGKSRQVCMSARRPGPASRAPVTSQVRHQTENLRRRPPTFAKAATNSQSLARLLLPPTYR